MKSLFEHREYQEDLCKAGAASLPWKELQKSTIVLSGGTGLIGSFLVDLLMAQNLYCNIHVIGRSLEKGKQRFANWWNHPLFHFVPADVTQSLEEISLPAHPDYVLHLASVTHPHAYAMEPIGTITSNVLGLKNMLDYAVESEAGRFLFASSNEIYGENRGDVELFDEHYCGFLDSNTLRAGYPEAKRCGEALCQAYIRQKGLGIVIPRLTRSFGPTLLPTDTKALSQFLRNAVAGEDIALKSQGFQYYSYTYVADAVTGLLTVLLKGVSGEAYNVADISCDIRLRDLAGLVAELAGVRVIFELPDAVEQAGFSRATKARLDGRKLHALGWCAQFPLRDALARTLRIMREMSC